MSTGLVVGLVVLVLMALATESAVGFGGTVIVVSIGAQFVPLDVMLPAYVPINLLLSAWLAVRGRHTIAWRLLLLEVVPPVAIGMAVGVTLFHLVPRMVLQLVFACFVVILASVELVGIYKRARSAPIEPRVLPPLVRWIFLIIGGVAHGLFAVAGPVIIYVLRRRVTDKTAFRASLAVLWFALNLLFLANLQSSHLFSAETSRLSLAFVLVLVPATWLGEQLHSRLAPKVFERVVWNFLLVAGLALAVRSIAVLM